jgi:hypothetical protein
MISKEKLTFTSTDAANSDSVGSILIGTDGNALTNTTVGPKKALDVNLAGSEISITTTTAPEELNLIDEASSTTFYFGYAPIGSAESAAVWKIERMIISGTVIKKHYASGDSTYTHIWDNRASLSYS